MSGQAPDRPVWRYFDIGLKVAFRGQTRRQGAVVQGPYGWGESSPFPGYAPDARSRCEQSALACAWEPFPEPVRDWIPVQVTVPALDPQDAADLVRASGCSCAKVKVAEGDDDARVAAVRDALGPGGRLVVDANGAWGVEEAVRNIRKLYRYSVDLVEQPVRGCLDMARVRKAVQVPLAADELVFCEEAVKHIVKSEAADVLVVKVQSLGGVSVAWRIVEASGLPAIVSNLIETSVGLAAGVALAAALPELPYPCGLGTAGLLEADLVADPLVPQAGRIRVRRPEVDPALLERFRHARPGPEGNPN